MRDAEKTVLELLVSHYSEVLVIWGLSMIDGAVCRHGKLPTKLQLFHLICCIYICGSDNCLGIRHFEWEYSVQQRIRLYFICAVQYLRECRPKSDGEYSFYIEHPCSWTPPVV